MLSVLLAVLEPFALIALGAMLRRTKRFSDKALWDGLETVSYTHLTLPTKA